MILKSSTSDSATLLIKLSSRTSKVSLHHYRIDDLITSIVVSFFSEKWKHFWCLTFLKFVNLHHELSNLNLYFPFESRLTFIAFIAVLFSKINNNLPYLSIAYIIYISYYIFLKLFFLQFISFYIFPHFFHFYGKWNCIQSLWMLLYYFKV